MKTQIKTQDVTRIGMGRLADLFAIVPGYGLVDRLTDIIAKRQRVRVIVTSDDYWELRICWGLIDFTKGSKREFLIEGGPGLCDAAMRSLKGSPNTIVSRMLER